DPVADFGHGALGDRAGPLGAHGQHPVQLRLVGEQLLGAFADGGEGFDDRFGDVLLEGPVPLALVAGHQVGDGRAGQRGLDAQQVGDAGLVLLVEADLRLGVGDGAHDLLAQRPGLFEDVEDAAGAGGGLGHLRGRVLEVGDLLDLFQDVRLGDGEGVAEAVVEPLPEVAGELQVLLLVGADGDAVGLVEQDVGGLEDRVGEQADAGGALSEPGGLVLELGHPPGLAHAGEAGEDPGQLGVLADVGLHEHGGALRVEPRGEELGGGDAAAAAQRGGLGGHRDRVQVHHAVERVVGLLQRDPLADRTQVVAQVEGVRGGLDAGENTRSGHSSQLCQVSASGGDSTTGRRFTRTFEMRRPSSSMTVSSKPFTSTLSFTPGTRPSAAMMNPASVSYGPSGRRMPVSSAKSLRLVSPSISLTPAGRMTDWSSTSYSSLMSPMSSSTRSSMVTMPAVPPYSSMTMHMCWPSSRISESVASRRLEAGTNLAGRIGTSSLSGSVRPVSTGS